MTNTMRYMVLKTNVRRIVLTFLLLVSATQVFAAIRDFSDSRYSGFVLKKELWVCSSLAFPIDISHNAFGVSFAHIVGSGYGEFIQVKPGEGLPLVVVQHNASGILNTLGKPAGVYEYVLVSRQNGFCGMNTGEMAVVRVYVVPQMTGFPVLTNVCPGATVKVDFNQYVPTEVRNFVNDMGWLLVFKDKNDNVVTMPLDANLGNVGNSVYTYSIDDGAAGSFQHKYRDMKTNHDGVYRCQEDSAILNHTVRIRDTAEFRIPDREVNFCLSNLLTATQPDGIFRTNLFSYLGSSVAGGLWSKVTALDGSSAPVTFPGNDRSTGNTEIDIKIINAVMNKPYKIVFEYHYKDCKNRDLVSKVQINITEDLTNIVTNTTKDVCRNLVSGVIDLSTTFGFSLPLTSGVWYEKSGNDYKQMLYGAANISDMKSGSLYTYKYSVTNAADDNLCGIKDTESIFNIRVQDIEIPNAEVQICRDLVNSGLTLNLFDYVPGLNDTLRIKHSQVIWYDSIGQVIPNGLATVQSTAEQVKNPQSRIEVPFQYSMSTDCGQIRGNLYVSAIDSILYANLHKTIRICYQDLYAEHVDLYQVIGLAGLKGSFNFLPRESVPNNKNLGSNYNQGTGVLNARDAFDTNNSVEEYVFEYAPAANENLCVKNNQKLKVTVIVTKNVENHNFFN